MNKQLSVILLILVLMVSVIFANNEIPSIFSSTGESGTASGTASGTGGSNSKTINTGSSYSGSGSNTGSQSGVVSAGGSGESGVSQTLYL